MDLDRDFVWVSKRLIEHEGLKLSPYVCPAGKLTIGVGRNLEDNPLNEKEKRALGDYMHGITKNGAMLLLRNDVEKCLKDLRKFEFWSKLDIERQYALLDMCFQLGYRGLCKFENMLYWMKLKDYKTASFHCLDSSYAVQTPKRAKRIAKLIKEGIWLR
jgi:lysozyme